MIYAFLLLTITKSDSMLFAINKEVSLLKMQTLSELRKNHGFTQESFADAIGVCTSVLCKWEQKRQMPSYENLRKIKRLLNCSYDELLED